MLENTTTRTKTIPALSLDAVLRALPGIFLLIFITVGSLMVVTKPGIFINPQGASWLNGEAALKVEKHFNEHLPLRQAYIDTWGVIEYVLFGQGREGVIVGQDGWLFTAEEFAHYADESAAINEKIKFVHEVQQTLDAQGVELVMVIVPAKARVYPEYLKGQKFPGYLEGRYTALEQALSSEDIPVIALDSAFKSADDQQLFFKTDTHWTQEGAVLAAQVSAQYLREQGYDLPFDQSTFKTNVVSQQRFQGDLTRYIPLGIFENSLGFQYESIKESVTVQTNLGLFADAGAPVVLVGSSYSGDARWNFSGALKEALGINVANAAQVGKGEVIPMQEYLSGAFLTDPKPKVVIWQVSERGFPMPFSESD